MSKVYIFDVDGVLIDTETFTRYARGCISYIKSGSGDNFPKKLYPIENTKIGELPIYKCDMDNIQSEIYNKIYLLSTSTH